MRRRRRSAVTLVVALGLCIAGSSGTVARDVATMGTRLRLTVAAADRSTALSASQSALEAIDETEARLSTWRSETELDRLNHSVPGAWMTLGPKLARDLDEAAHWWVETEGAFDPGVSSLVRVWDLRGDGRIPTDDELEQARGSAGFGAFELVGRRARRLTPGFGIEEGGFGKGIAIRDAAEAALAAGASCVMLDFGGQVHLEGACTERTIGIADPRQRDRVIAEFTLQSGSAATSGASERFVTVDTQTLGHILDPVTGRPLEDWGSVTVIADDPVAADCVATALYVMGPMRGTEWAASRSDVKAVFAVVDGAETRLTATLRDLHVIPGTGATLVARLMTEK